VNVVDHGVVGDGVTDDTAAIQAALDAAAAGPRIVVIPQPSAFYKVTAPIRIPHGVALRGQSRTSFVGPYAQSAPRIEKTTNTTVPIPRFEDGVPVARDCIFYIDPTWSPPSGGAPDGFYPQNVEISGLTIAGAGPSLVETAVFLEQGSGLLFANSDAYGVRHGFYGRDVFRSRFESLRLKARFKIEVAGTSLVLINVSSGGSPDGFDGFNLRGVLYSTMVGCTSDGFHESAYTFQSSRVTMIGCGAEAGDSTSATAGTGINEISGSILTLIGFTHVAKAGSKKPIISTGDFSYITIEGSDLRAGRGDAPSAYDLHAGRNSQVTFRNTTFGALTVPPTQPSIIYEDGSPVPRVRVEFADSVIDYTPTTTTTDGYRTGTWTPALAFDGVTTGITYNDRGGAWTRQGNLLVAQGYINLSSKGSATGTVTITGFPFSAPATAFGSVTVNYQANMAAGVHGSGDVKASGPNVFLYKASAPATYLDDTDVTNATQMRFTIMMQISTPELLLRTR
jgi:hypothetical protein